MLDMLDLYSNILSGILSGIYSGILSGIRSYSDILSGILSGIYSDILSDIISGFTHRKVDRRFWVLSWTFFFLLKKMGLRKTTTPRFQDTEFRLKKITLGYPYHDTNQHGSQVINLLYIYINICIINILPGATSNNLLGGFSPPEEKNEFPH
jgi:hypothetical protein